MKILSIRWYGCSKNTDSWINQPSLRYLFCNERLQTPTRTPRIQPESHVNKLCEIYFPNYSRFDGKLLLEHSLFILPAIFPHELQGYASPNDWRVIFIRLAMLPLGSPANGSDLRLLFVLNRTQVSLSDIGTGQRWPKANQPRNHYTRRVGPKRNKIWLSRERTDDNL
jgi:hypothetical protein